MVGIQTYYCRNTQTYNNGSSSVVFDLLNTTATTATISADPSNSPVSRHFITASLGILDWNNGTYTWYLDVSTANSGVDLTAVNLYRYPTDGYTIKASKTNSVSVNLGTTGVKSGTITWNDGTQNPSATKASTDDLGVEFIFTRASGFHGTQVVVFDVNGSADSRVDTPLTTTVTATRKHPYHINPYTIPGSNGQNKSAVIATWLLKTSATATSYFPISSGFANTHYDNTTEAHAQIACRPGAVFSKFGAQIVYNDDTNGSSTIRLRKNGANANQVLSIGSETTGRFEDSSNTDTFADGDLSSVSYTQPTDATPFFIDTLVYCTVKPSANTLTYDTTTIKTGTTITTASATRYLSLGPETNFSSTNQTLTDLIFPANHVARNLQVYVSSNSRTTTTTVRPLRNGHNITQSISIGSTQTGRFEDTTNKDPITKNSTLGFAITTGTGTEALQLRLIGLTLESYDNEFFLFNNTQINYTTLTNNVTSDIPLVSITASTIEDDNGIKIPFTTDWSNLKVRINANSLNSGTSTFTGRKNDTTNTSLTLSVGAGSTGSFSDITNTVSLSANDTIQARVVTGGTSGTIAIRYIQTLLEDTSTGTTTVTATRTHKYNIIATVTVTKTHKYNLIQILTATRTHKYNLLNSVSATRTHKYNLLELVSSLRTHKYNIIGLVTALRTHKYNIEQLVTATRTHKYNIIQTLTATRTHLYNIIGLLTETRTHLYNIIQQLTTTRTHKFNVQAGTTPVTTTRTHLFNILNLVTSTRTHKYNLEQLVQALKTHKYNIIGLVTTLRTHKYNIIELLTTTRTHLYNVEQLVVALRTHKYHIQSLVSALKTHKYNILETVTKTTTHKYNIIALLAALRTHKYDIVGLVQALRTHKYDMEGLVSTLKTHKFNILEAVSKTATHKYNILALVQALRTHKYNIIGLVTTLKTHKYNIITQITSTRTHKYNIIELITTLRTHKYNILEAVKALKTHKYNIIALVTALRTHKYHLEGLVTTTRTHLYNIVNAVTATKTHKFNLLEVVTKTTTHKYNITALLTSLRTHKYNLVQTITETRTHLYNLLQSLTTTKTHKYNIVAAVTATRTHLYNIIQQITALRTHKYNVESALTTVTANRTHKYNIIAKLTTTRTHLYNVLNTLTATRTHKFNLLNAVSATTRTHKFNIIGLIKTLRTHKYDLGGVLTTLRTHRFGIESQAMPEGAGGYMSTTVYFPRKPKEILDIIPAELQNTVTANILVFEPRYRINVDADLALISKRTNREIVKTAASLGFDSIQALGLQPNLVIADLLTGPVCQQENTAISAVEVYAETIQKTASTYANTTANIQLLDIRQHSIQSLIESRKDPVLALANVQIKDTTPTTKQSISLIANRIMQTAEAERYQLLIKILQSEVFD